MFAETLLNCARFTNTLFAFSDSEGFSNSTLRPADIVICLFFFSTSTLAELGEHACTHTAMSLSLCHRAITLLQILCFGPYL